MQVDVKPALPTDSDRINPDVDRQVNRLDGQQHFTGKQKRVRECIVCSNRKEGRRFRNETSYFCDTCIEKPAMHPECMKRYHTLAHFKLLREKPAKSCKVTATGGRKKATKPWIFLAVIIFCITIIGLYMQFNGICCF